MARNFLGRGWKYPVEVDRAGGIAMSELDESIRQSMLIILGTAPGERVMRPNFGCSIHDLVYAPNNLNTASLAAHFCIEALGKWEPRIELQNVNVQEGNQPSQVLVSIDYRIRTTNELFNLVYPLYVQEGAG